jgi:hypothetical protein
MSTILCPNCAHANSSTSKFCNNCGQRLPTSTEIICPNCQTPNPHNLFYCDHCGARLVKENLPTEVESDPDLEEPEQSSVLPADLFSLPTRKPGDTGKLDLNTLPDWLRKGGQEEDEELETEDELPQSSESEEGTLQGSTTDGLPDWLLTDSSADIYQPPSEIFTEAFLQMTEDEPPELSDRKGITDDLNLPDWLTDAVRDTDTLIEKKPTRPQPDEATELPNPFETSTNIPEWLAEVGGLKKDTPPTPEEETDEEIPTVEEWGFSESAYDDTPDWLRDSGDETAEPDVAQKGAVDLSDLQEWGTAVAPSTNLPNWYDELARPTKEKLNHWLLELDGLAEPEFLIEEPEGNSVADRLADWLSEDDESDTIGTDDRKVTGMLTGWLSEFEEDDESDYHSDDKSEDNKVITGMLTGWLTELDDEDEPDFTADAPATDQFASWLEDEDKSDELEFLAEAVEDEEPEPDQFTEWLSDSDESDELDFMAEPPPTGQFTGWLADDDESDELDFLDQAVEDEETEPDQYTEWLSDLDESEELDLIAESPSTGQFTSWLSDEDESEGFDFLDEAIEDEEAQPGQFTEWLSDSGESEQADFLTETPDTGQYTSWQTGEDEPDELDFLDEAVEDEETEPDQNTEWLFDLDESDEPDFLTETPETGQFTGWLAGGDEPDELDLEEEEQEREEEITTGMLTGWLSDLEEEEEEEEKAVTGMLTGWLAELDAEDEASSLEEEEEEEKAVTGMLTGWLTELDAEDEATFQEEDEEEPELEPGMFTAWLTDDDDSVLAEEIMGEEATAESTADSLPDWLDDLEQVSPESAASYDDEVDDLDMDWMVSATGDLFTEEDVFEETADELDLESESETAWPVDSDTFTTDHDWMSELDKLDEEDVAAADESVPLPEPAFEVEEEPEPIQESTPSDTLEEPITGPIAEEEESEAVPDWLTDLRQVEGQDDERKSSLVQEDLPDWLSNMKPSRDTEGSSFPGLGLDVDLSDDFAEIPPELSGADLPDWLQGISTSPKQREGDSASAEYSTDISDWLGSGDGESNKKDASRQLRSILSELPPPRDPKEGLAKADIPEWIDALKPKELTGGSQQPAATSPAPESGPLLGVEGVIEIAPVMAAVHEAHGSPVSQLTITPEQQLQAELLQQLAEGELLLSETAVSPRRRLAWGRVLLYLILLAIMSMVIILDGRFSLVQEDTVPAPTSIAAAQTAVTDAAGQSVLVAFDYTPALEGELAREAEALMAQLAANDSSVIAMSQSAAGTAIAATYTDNPALYIPGEAIGLRQMSACLAEGCNMLFGRSLENDLSQVSLIIVLTGERKSLVNWIEQVGAQTDVPLLAAITQSLEPVAMSYMTSGQLDGIMSHSAALGRYEDTLSAATADPVGQRALNAQVLVQLVLVVLLLLSLIGQMGRAAMSRNR